jgi:hypothetical protein
LSIVDDGVHIMHCCSEDKEAEDPGRQTDAAAGEMPYLTGNGEFRVQLDIANFEILVSEIAVRAQRRGRSLTSRLVD